LIETNLPLLFGARFVATEFSTGAKHAGRIDTLALDENDNPMIIEYKVIESSDLINQSLFYLSWLDDHRGEFELTARKKLGDKIEFDWDKIRVICISPGFKKYDMHAVGMMGANIELWQFQLHEEDILDIDKVFPRSDRDYETGLSASNGKNPIMIAAGRKAAETRRTATYTFVEHLKGKDQTIMEIVTALREYILALAETIEEAPKKLYIAYKVSQNFVCMEVQKRKVYLFLKLNPSEVGKLPIHFRDVSNIGHYGTGDIECTIRSLEQIDEAKLWIKKAFDSVAG